MIEVFRLPDLGEGLTESEIVAWRVAEGETVRLDQILADVETAKALVELPSPLAGVVKHLHAAEGATVPVGSPLVSFLVGDAPGSAVPSSDVPSSDVQGADVPGPQLVGSPDSAIPESAAADADALPPNLVGYGAAAEGSGHPVRRPRRAADRSTAPASDGIERIPVAGVRRATAAAMVASAAVPQVTVWLSVDVTATLELLDRQRDAEGRAPTVLAAVARALCLAVRRTPEVNSRWDGTEILRFRDVHLAVAVATPRGLLVPVLREAQREDLAGLATGIRGLARTAREGRCSPAQLTGGTITVTNIGVFGVDGGAPMLHDGQAAIIAVGAVARRPWERAGVLALRSVLTLSLTVDHRVLDGEQAARFLADCGALLADPALAFAR